MNNLNLDKFLVQELVTQTFFQRYGQEAMRYCDPRMLAVLEAIRDYVDAPMTINNWHSGGNRQWSGLRTPDSPWYNVGSAHSWGMAFDAVGPTDPDDIRGAIISGQLMLPYPVRLEMDISWLHVDVMNVSQERVEIFYP